MNLIARTRRCAWLLVVASIALGSAGCGPSFPTAEVDGTLTIAGKPGRKVRIEFVPDGRDGPVAGAETDENGRFVLFLRERNAKQPRPGAMVGPNRVVLSDNLLSESSDGKGVTSRFSPEYSLPSSTPLRKEVVAGGKQTIDISLP